jgi:hypothetical protein
MTEEEIDRLYRSILGPFPERVPLNLEFLEEDDCDGFTRSLISWDNDATERVRGYLLRPAYGSAISPGMVAFHGHGAWGSGKRSTAGVDLQDGKRTPRPRPGGTRLRRALWRCHLLGGPAEPGG